MYPHKLFLGLTAYDILICVGIVVCFVSFGFLADKRRIKGKFQNFALVCGVIAISLGLGSAVLFQALYNIKSRGGFVIAKNTGATFYGGLIGGVCVFLLLWFVLGSFIFKNRETKKEFFTIASCAVPSIVVAHSFGRVGCLMAGCCHGELTDAWYGLMMYGNFGYDKYVPIQLFEALFLLALFAVLFVRALKGSRYNLPIYMCIYGAWRFAIEFLRNDYRGDLPFEGVTPSQFIAILMIAGSIGVFFLERWFCNKLDAEKTSEIISGEKENMGDDSEDQVE